MRKFMSNTDQEGFLGVEIAFIVLKIPSSIFPSKYSIIHNFFLLFLTF